MKTITESELKTLNKLGLIDKTAWNTEIPKSWDPGYIYPVAHIKGEVYRIVNDPVEPKKLTLEEILTIQDKEVTIERLKSLRDQERARRVLQKKMADYLNGDWKPDWEDDDARKYYIGYFQSELTINWKTDNLLGEVSFKSEDAALEALKILGSEKIKTALGCHLKP